MVDETLAAILGLHRAKDSAGEKELIEKLIIPTGAKPDEFGNYILRIGTAPILFSCHTDTVHKDYENMYQPLLMVEESEIILSKSSNCLGADNGAGIFLCLKLIEKGVEGLYIFHRQEETGGKGSAYIAKHTPELLDGIQYAIAFDRRGTESVITHQMTRTCSDNFAEQLCVLLGMEHKPDDSGTFTDTANYSHIIPECTNISAGFYKEHTSGEWLDTRYLMALCDKLLQVDWTELSAHRDVNDNEYADLRYSYWHGFTQQNQYHGADLIWQYPLKTYSILAEFGIVDDVLKLLREYEDEIDH